MKNKTKLYDIEAPREEEKPNVLKESYLKELEKLIEKMPLAKGEAQVRLLKDYLALCSVLKDLKFITEEEYSDLIKKVPIEFDKYNFRMLSRNVLNNTKFHNSHDDLYKLIRDLIVTSSQTYLYEEEDTTHINPEKISEIMRGFFKWVSDDCFEFYQRLVEKKHIIKSNKDTLESYSMTASYGTDSIVYFGTSDKSIYQLDVYAHEFGHAYAAYLCRNSSYVGSYSQYTEFYSIFFEMLFNQYLDEQHLYVEERKKMRRNDLYGRLFELERAYLLEELVEKGYVNDRYGFSFKNSLTNEELINMFATGIIPNKDELLEQRKIKKAEKNKVKEKSVHEEKLLSLLMKLKDSFDYSKFNYNTDNKEYVVDKRLEAITELIREGNIENALSILKSLLPMIGDKNLIREFYSTFTRYYLNKDFLKVYFRELFEIDDIKDDEIFSALISSYVSILYTNIDSLTEINDIIFDEYLTEQSKNSILLAFLNMIIEDDSKTIFREVFTNYKLIKDSEEIKENDNYLVELYNKYIEYVYNNFRDDKVKVKAIFGKYINNIDDIYEEYINNRTEDSLSEFNSFALTYISKIIEIDDNNSINLLIDYYKLIIDRNNDITSIIDELFSKDSDKTSIINEFCDYFKSDVKENCPMDINEYFKNKYYELANGIYINVTNQIPNAIKDIVDGLIKFAKDDKVELVIRDLLKVYVKENFKDNENDYEDIIDYLKLVISINDLDNYDKVMRTILFRATKDENLVTEIINETLETFKEHLIDASEKEKYKLFDQLKCELGTRDLDYHVHQYIVGRIFASYFADMVKLNHKDGIKSSIDFLTVADHYSVSEALELFPTALYHAKEYIARTLTPEEEYLNAYNPIFETLDEEQKEEIINKFIKRLRKDAYKKELNYIVKKYGIDNIQDELIDMYLKKDKSFEEFRNSKIKNKIIKKG